MSTHLKKIERPFELKKVNSDGTIIGYASVYGEIDSYRDVVIKGAFDNSLERRYRAKGRKAVPMLDQHNSTLPIGIWPIAAIKEDDHGLMVHGEVNMKVQRAADVHALADQGALSGLSIGYMTMDDEWDESGKVRILKEVDLWEISMVTFPAGDSARVTSVKSIMEMTSITDCEKKLRDAGFSRVEAAAFLAQCMDLKRQAPSTDDESEVVRRILKRYG